MRTSASATAVNLISFTATGRDGAVRVAWETARESGNRGFHLFRAPSPGRPLHPVDGKAHCRAGLFDH